MIDNIISIIDSVFGTLSLIDVRGYNDRKAVVKAQEGLIEAYRALIKMKKKEETDAEHCDGDGGSKPPVS